MWYVQKDKRNGSEKLVLEMSNMRTSVKQKHSDMKFIAAIGGRAHSVGTGIERTDVSI